MDGWKVAGFAEVRELGTGGQGRAVLVREEATGHVAVLKYVFGEAEPGVRRRFQQESLLLKGVTSPYVARWYGHFEDAGGSAILMEAVAGISLGDLLAVHAPLTPQISLLVLKGSLHGLAAAHERGVVHLDYKPSNVIVRPDGLSKLIDFGVASLAGETSGAGTPPYMAPEQIRREPGVPATDVYAATCVFFECVTGEAPYGKTPRRAVWARHLEAPIPVERVPPPLRPLLERGMAKAVGDRPPGAAEFVAELEAVAAEAYGPDWEEQALRGLALAAAALSALFPLAAAAIPAASTVAPAGAAAGGAPAAASGAVRGGRTALNRIASSKVAVAAAGATAVIAVGGALIYRDMAPAASPSHRTAARPGATASAPTQAITVGAVTFRVPVTWRADRSGHPNGYDQLTAPGTCAQARYGSSCPGLLVLTGPYVRRTPSVPIDPYTPSSPYAVQVFQDYAHSCPTRPNDYAGGVSDGARLVGQGTATVGGQPATYREWRIPCWTRDSNGGPAARDGVVYTERDWYIATRSVLLVDEWDLAELPGLLGKVTWA